MKKDIEWLKKEIEEYLAYEGVRYARTALESVLGYIDQLDEPEKVVIPQFVADWFENDKRDMEIEDVFWQIENCEMVKLDVDRWISDNRNTFIRAWLDGYEVEKEILWEIPLPDLKTTSGHIQYLTYDPKARTYFGSRQNGRLKQTFNAKDLASVPGQYRRYAELCDFKKIEEATK